MKNKNLLSAKLMARMARDGDVEALAEVISEIMETPETAEAPTTPGEAPVVIETPTEQPVIVDCGPQILEALGRIISLLSSPAADCDPAKHAGDEDPENIAEVMAETAAGEMAESVAAAAVEAVAEAMEPALNADEDILTTEDPVEELVAEILESDEDSEENDPEEEAILSSILEPEDTSDEDPDDNAQAADALRAALATFRPLLARMNPKDRRRFNADVAARMKQLTRKQGSKDKPNAYATLRSAAARDESGRSLGQKIMANRNANLRK